MKKFDDIFQYIDDNADHFVGELQTLMRQPSVSAEDWGIDKGAALVQTMMEQIGITADILPARHSSFVVGEMKSGESDKTLLVTSHYDVVPPGPLEQWDSDPFAAEIRDGRIYGRGAADPKGNLVATFKAAEAWRAVRGDIPVNLKFLIDGDDESRLGDFRGFVEQHKARLAADAVLLVDAGFTRDGNSPVHLGNVGSLTVDLSVQTGSKDPYIIWTQLVPDAAYRLVWALASLKDANEKVLIDGFYDDVYRPNEADLALLATYPWTDEGELEFWGIDRFVTGVEGVEAVRRLLFEPTCSICGIEPGIRLDDAGTLVPSRAGARVNFHLVPDQDPADILDKLQAHLAQHGLEDVEISVYRQHAPIAGSPDSEIGQALVRGASAAGVRSYLMPYSFELGYAWSGLGKQLGVDGALIGIADPDRRAHFANENISVDYYLRGIKWIAAAYGEYGS